MEPFFFAVTVTNVTNHVIFRVTSVIAPCGIKGGGGGYVAPILLDGDQVPINRSCDGTGRRTLRAHQPLPSRKIGFAWRDRGRH